ncbi:MAG: hypothetical protein MUC33_17575 [Desulfobacterales bacterium]|nr:hypothetical protein [Desulfobacterales bacterium]
MPTPPPLIIPVENQVRELDPKLLLACIAARRGFTSIIGSHREIDFRIASFPRGLYLNKSMTERNLKMFQIMHRVGHEILTWDEEALVHLPPEIYYSRRLSPVAIRYVSHLFAWGENNADLWRRYPHLPQNLPIHVTGNPRNDMLRPELHAFYADEVRAIRERYGNYLLVNTNFNHVNAFFPAQNLFKPVKHPGETPRFGKAGVGMTRQFAEALRDQKQSVFEAFQALIPELARAFPALSIVVRPHPTEGQDAYRRLASGNSRVHVTNEGNVVPWLLGAKALIHNGDADSGFQLPPVRQRSHRHHLLCPAARTEPSVFYDRRADRRGSAGTGRKARRRRRRSAHGPGRTLPDRPGGRTRLRTDDGRPAGDHREAP